VSIKLGFEFSLLIFDYFQSLCIAEIQIHRKAQFDAGQRCRACGDGCVNAACLPSAAETGGKACWIAGWGTTEENGSSPATMSSGNLYFFEIDVTLLSQH